MDIGTDARFFTMTYFKDHDASHIEEIERTYNQVFGATPNGVAGMVASFSDQLTDGLRQDTMQRLRYRILCRDEEPFRRLQVRQTDNKTRMTPNIFLQRTLRNRARR